MSGILRHTPGVHTGLGALASGAGLPEPVLSLTASFNVDTISGDLAWTDSNSGNAQYQIYSSTNGADYELLGTTDAGAESYSDTTCKQNADVIYKIIAKIGSGLSDETLADVISTPLCLKTDQSVLTTVTVNALNVLAGKTVNIDWGDGSNTDYTGNNSSITHDYGVGNEGQYNIKLSGDINFITSLQSFNQIIIYGDVSNWIIPTSLNLFRFNNTLISGDVSNWIIPKNTTYINLRACQLSGKIPNIENDDSIYLGYTVDTNNFTGFNINKFRVSLSILAFQNQRTVVPTLEIDNLLKNAADYYEINAPESNTTINVSGTNMGIPTGGASNVDIVRLIGYHTAASKTATVVVRTS